MAVVETDPASGSIEFASILSELTSIELPPYNETRSPMRASEKGALQQKHIQWGSEYRTNSVFKWSILPKTGHQITGPFKNWTNFSSFEWSGKLDHFIHKRL
jgi:hypothetical protein